MSQKQTDELHKSLVEKNGQVWTLMKLRSECHELTDAINDYLNRPITFNYGKVVEECADVKVLIDRLCFYGDHMSKKELEKIGIEKMKRALQRLENENT